MSLAAEPHLAHGDFDGEYTPILSAPNNLPPDSGSARLATDAVKLEGVVVPPFAKLGDNRAEILTNQLGGGIPEHPLRAWVHRLYQAIARLQRHDPVRHGIEDGLDKGHAVPPGLLCSILRRDVPEHEDRPDDPLLAVVHGRAAIRDRALASILRYQDGMVREAMNCSRGQGLLHRDYAGQSRLLVNNVEDFVDGPPDGVCLGPTRESLCHRVQESDAALGVRGNQPVANGMDDHGEFLFARVKLVVCSRELAARLLLVFEEHLGLGMDQAL